MISLLEVQIIDLKNMKLILFNGRRIRIEYDENGIQQTDANTIILMM